MSLEQLPLELAVIVFERLECQAFLSMRLVSRTVATLAQGYFGDFYCRLDVSRHYMHLTARSMRGQNDRVLGPLLFPRRQILFVNLKNATINGLRFWLRCLTEITFDRMDSHESLQDMKAICTVLESVGVLHQVRVEFAGKMWLGSFEFGDAMNHLKETKLNLAVTAEMIAKHSFETQRSKNNTLMPLSKMSKIHMKIPGNRMVSDRLVFENDRNVEKFKITSCGESRPSLWNVGSMVDLFATCNSVRHVDLNDLTITVDTPLKSADWSLSNVEVLTLTNCSLKLSTKARRRGNKEKKGSLDQARCFVAVLAAPGVDVITILSATFVRDDEQQQLVLDKLQLGNGSKQTTAIVTSTVFKTCPVRHLTLNIGINMNVLLEFAQLKNLQYLIIRPPVIQMVPQERQALEANIDRLFTELDQKCPHFVQASIKGVQLEKSFRRLNHRAQHISASV